MSKQRRTQANSLPAVRFADDDAAISFVHFGDGQLFIRTVTQEGVNTAHNLPPIEIERLRTFLAHEFPQMEVPSNAR